MPCLICDLLSLDHLEKIRTQTSDGWGKTIQDMRLANVQSVDSKSLFVFMMF